MARTRRAARRDRGRGQDAGAAPHRVPRVRPRRRPLAARRRALRGALRVRPRGPRARRRLGRRRRRAPPPRLLPAPLPPGWPARARTPVGEVLDGVLAGEEVDVDEIVTLLGARGPDFLEVAAVADQLRARRGRRPGHVRPQPQHQLHERVHVQVQVLRVLEGPALAQPARRRRTSSSIEEMQRRVLEAVDCGATEVCLQGGIHPDFDGNYYLDGRARGEGGRAADPRARVHRARGHRRRAPARHAAARLPRARRRKPGSPRCPAPRPRSSTTRCGRSSAPTRSTPRSGSTPTAPRTRSGCARTSRSCSGTSNGRCTSPATSCAPARCRRRPAASPSSCRCRSCTWPRRSSCSRRLGAGPTMREVLLDARGRAHRVPGLDRQHAGVVGEDRRRRCPPGAAGRVQRPRRHADGREHLACRGRQPRPGARRVELRAIVEPLGRPLEQRTTLYGRTHTEGRRLRPPPEAVEADRVAAPRPPSMPVSSACGSRVTGS